MSILSVNDLVANRVKDHADAPVLGITDKNFKLTMHTLGELDLSATLVAQHFAAAGLPTRARGDSTTKHTVALLAPSNYDYVVTEMALCKMGLATLFISINNSSAAIAHLLKETRSTHLILHPAYAKVAAEALATLDSGFSCETVPMAKAEVYSEEARKSNPSATWSPALTPEEEASTVAFIVHSSGSTGFPKPIELTHRSMAANAPSYDTSVFVTLPLYHYTGHSCLYRALHLVKPAFLYPASDLPLTPSNLLAMLKLCQPETLFAVPMVYKQLSESAEGVARLREFEACFFAGSAMADEVGNKLVAEGVHLVTFYGSTETGALMTSVREFETDKEWAYCRIGDAFEPYCLLEPRDEGLCELVCKDGWPKKVVSNRPDGSYATKDVFVRHQSIPNAIKFQGRIDDTIVLNNGEKCNPVPMEATLKELPFVSEAVVFGVSRSQTGVPISHAEIGEEMVVFLPHDTAVPKADKGSIIRAKVYEAFAAHIDKAYINMEQGTGSSEEPKISVGAVEEMQVYLSELLGKVAGARVGLDDDLFSAGLDSLQAGRIRTSLQREFEFGRRLPTNLVFDHPTVRQLATFLVAFAAGDTIVKLSAHEQMLAYVDQYSRFDTPSRKPAADTKPGNVVVLTGATGSLGSQLLAELLSRDTVTKVYALVRAHDDVEAAGRISKVARGSVDPRVVALASDFSQDRLGLSRQRYEEIAQGVTLVLHNAWSVNFNLNITSFEPHIRGAHNLIKLCLESSHLADFYFASSISAVGAWPGSGRIPERVTEDPAMAMDMGYGQSKWVTEKICEITSQSTPVRAVVLRIVQMVGRSVDGRWNETEAVSLMIKSAQTIGCLPDLKEDVSWLPVDYAARIILELAALPAPAPGTSQTWHIVQPKLVAWSSVLKSLRASGLKFEIVAPADWLQRLRSGPQDPSVNPTIKLLSYYEGEYSESASAHKWAPLDTTNTAAASKSFREAPYPDDVLVGKFVRAWRATGFLV
ncbi:hypothetical protein RQP46_006131 [Phenoliferia psychrophenolica]